MNSRLNEDIPVGRTPKLQPKRFDNSPYNNNHTDPALRGTTPLPATHAELYEYPLTPNGWTGHNRVGHARVITSTVFFIGYYHDHFHGVLYHDAGRGGLWDDHYLATTHRTVPSYTLLKMLKFLLKTTRNTFWDVIALIYFGCYFFCVDYLPWLLRL
jgi:hypothetical protein